MLLTRNNFVNPESPVTISGHLALNCDEFYVRDQRDNVRPSEVVQSKLLNVMPQGMAIPVSCRHFRRDVRR